MDRAYILEIRFPANSFRRFENGNLLIRLRINAALTIIRFGVGALKLKVFHKLYRSSNEMLLISRIPVEMPRHNNSKFHPRVLLICIRVRGTLHRVTMPFQLQSSSVYCARILSRNLLKHARCLCNY